MALAGAFRLVPDEPGAVCVVVFPDNVFKYTSSLRKHLPELFPSKAAEEAPRDEEIDSKEAARRLRAGALLLDVRTPEEFATGHVAGAVNLPLQALQAGSTRGLPGEKSRPIVTICATGRRSVVALPLLRALGHAQVSSCRGGMRDWNP
jgi:rhodanese-related sulfurtransferase